MRGWAPCQSQVMRWGGFAARAQASLVRMLALALESVCLTSPIMSGVHLLAVIQRWCQAAWMQQAPSCISRREGEAGWGPARHLPTAAGHPHADREVPPAEAGHRGGGAATPPAVPTGTELPAATGGQPDPEVTWVEACQGIPIYSLRVWPIRQAEDWI